MNTRRIVSGEVSASVILARSIASSPLTMRGINVTTLLFA
jgi:hypothetical protein